MNRHCFWFGLVLSLLTSQVAMAACMTVDRTTTPGTLETFYFCKNSLPKPAYSIVQHYSGENFIGIFNFDPRGANIVCNDYELDKAKMADCREAGIGQIKKKYKSRNAIVETLNISPSEKPNLINSRRARIKNEGNRDYGKVYDNDGLYSYPDTVDEVPIEQCFVFISKKKVITIGYDKNNYMALSTCLIKLEEYFKSNKKLLLELWR